MASQKIVVDVPKVVEKEAPIARKSNVIFNQPIIVEFRVVTVEFATTGSQRAPGTNGGPIMGKFSSARLSSEKR
jgi:hypothetical protein